MVPKMPHDTGNTMEKTTQTNVVFSVLATTGSYMKQTSISHTDAHNITLVKTEIVLCPGIIKEQTGG